jgi:hypothetical protein
MNKPLNNISKKNSTLIFILINKVSIKNMQDIIFFLQNYGLTLKRINQKSNHLLLKPFFINSSFLIESTQDLSLEQVTVIIKFLCQFVILTGLIHKQQVLNLNRILNSQKDPIFLLWQQLNAFAF